MFFLDNCSVPDIVLGRGAIALNVKQEVSDTLIGDAVLSRSVVSDSVRPYGLQPTRLLCPWDSPGKNTRIGCSALLQGIFQIQRWNPGLLHCSQILYHLSHQGSPSFGDIIIERQVWASSVSAAKKLSWKRGVEREGGYFIGGGGVSLQSPLEKLRAPSTLVICLLSFL